MEEVQVSRTRVVTQGAHPLVLHADTPLMSLMTVL